MEGFSGAGQHVDGPGADYAVGGAGDDVVGVLGADKGEGVDGVGVASGVVGDSCEGGLGDRVGGFGADVPEENLAAVGAAEEEGGMEGREFGGEDVGGRVEGVFGAGLEMEVPDLDETGGVVGGGGAFGVGCED